MVLNASVILQSKEAFAPLSPMSGVKKTLTTHHKGEYQFRRSRWFILLIYTKGIEQFSAFYLPLEGVNHRPCNYARSQGAVSSSGTYSYMYFRGYTPFPRHPCVSPPWKTQARSSENPELQPNAVSPRFAILFSRSNIRTRFGVCPDC